MAAPDDFEIQALTWVPSRSRSLHETPFPVDLSKSHVFVGICPVPWLRQPPEVITALVQTIRQQVGTIIIVIVIISVISVLLLLLLLLLLAWRMR
jgi:hypothetical protein